MLGIRDGENGNSWQILRKVENIAAGRDLSIYDMKTGALIEMHWTTMNSPNVLTKISGGNARHERTASAPNAEWRTLRVT